MSELNLDATGRGSRPFADDEKVKRLEEELTEAQQEIDNLTLVINQAHENAGDMQVIAGRMGLRAGENVWKAIPLMIKDITRLQAERDALRKELERSESAHAERREHEDTGPHENCPCRFCALQKRMDGLVEAMKRYGRHHPDCARNVYHIQTPIEEKMCSCGFRDALDPAQDTPTNEPAEVIDVYDTASARHAFEILKTKGKVTIRIAPEYTNVVASLGLPALKGVTVVRPQKRHR